MNVNTQALPISYSQPSQGTPPTTNNNQGNNSSTVSSTQTPVQPSGSCGKNISIFV